MVQSFIGRAAQHRLRPGSKRTGMLCLEMVIIGHSILPYFHYGRMVGPGQFVGPAQRPAA